MYNLKSGNGKKTLKLETFDLIEHTCNIVDWHLRTVTTEGDREEGLDLLYFYCLSHAQKRGWGGGECGGRGSSEHVFIIIGRPLWVTYPEQCRALLSDVQ